ncbi:hypothetical protein ACVGXO_11185, partial [Enterobacter hormaechei]
QKRVPWLLSQMSEITGRFFEPTPNEPGANTSSSHSPVFFVADVPKPTFYRLPCGSHADNFT